VPAWIAQQIAVRGFYARGDTWRPMWIGTAVAVAAARSTTLLGRWYGVDRARDRGRDRHERERDRHARFLRAWYGGPSLARARAPVARALAIAASRPLPRRAIPPLGAGRSGALLDLASAARCSRRRRSLGDPVRGR
jgi:hypothetical protein